MIRPREVPLGEERGDGDGCRRYRPVAVTFDTRNVLLDVVIQDGWDQAVKDLWTENKLRVREGLLCELGVQDGDAKIDNYRTMGPAPWSVVFEHNHLLSQVRSAFAHGDFYPALVGACALGERLLAQLIFALRNDFVNHPKTTKRVRKGGPFTDWGTAIDVLHGWEVLSDDQAAVYRDLEQQRHAAVHFNPKVVGGQLEPALRALFDLQRIIEGVFSPNGGPPRFIADTPGVHFLSLESEATPLVRRVFIPQSVLVSPVHQMEHRNGQNWFAIDDADYESAPLTDAEFATHFNQAPVRPAD